MDQVVRHDIFPKVTINHQLFVSQFPVIINLVVDRFKKINKHIMSNQDMQTEAYNTSFVAGSLFTRESLAIARMYFEILDWEKARVVAINDNTIQARTTSSLVRITREICFRLSTLDNNELELFIDSSPQEQGYLLWLVNCRYYQFIREFANEVVRERFVTLRFDLHYDDFDAFYNAKAEWHEELEKNSLSTRKKLRQVLFRMLREADLLTKDNVIKAALLTPRLAHTISRNSNRDLYIFPVLESDLKEWLP